MRDEKHGSLSGCYPPEKRYTQIPRPWGGHAHSGSYGPKRGDLDAAISAGKQQCMVIETTVHFLEQMHYMHQDQI